MVALVVLEAFVLALVLVLVAGLLRSHADILRALHELGVGVPAGTGTSAPGTLAGGIPVAPPTRMAAVPAGDIAGTTPLGDAIVVSPSAAREDTLLAFLSSGCLTCEGVWAELQDDPEVPGGARIVVVTHGADRESPSRVHERASGLKYPVVMSSEAFDAYQVPGAPYFVLVAPDGTLRGEGTAARWDQVGALVERAARDEGSTRDVHAWSTDANREARNDGELLAAGIGPGDPRLFFAAGDDDKQGEESLPAGHGGQVA